jgi:hypothetical protein
MSRRSARGRGQRLLCLDIHGYRLSRIAEQLTMSPNIYPVCATSTRGWLIIINCIDDVLEWREDYTLFASPLMWKIYKRLGNQWRRALQTPLCGPGTFSGNNHLIRAQQRTYQIVITRRSEHIPLEYCTSMRRVTSCVHAINVTIGDTLRKNVP